MEASLTDIIDQRKESNSTFNQVLRRDKVTLGETGQICFGGKPDENPTGIATFTCK